jgi:hypothetical protein
MPHKPREMAIVYEINETLCLLYAEAVNFAPEIKEELYSAAIRAKKIYYCLYDLWQLFGGVSDIQSIFDDFNNFQGEMEYLCNKAKKILEERRKKRV